MIYHKHFKKGQSFIHKNDGTVITENNGYLTVEQQVKLILDAGQQVAQARKEMYQYDVNGNNIAGDITNKDIQAVRHREFDYILKKQKELNRGFQDKFTEMRKRKEEELQQLYKTSETPTTVETQQQPTTTE